MKPRMQFVVQRLSAWAPTGLALTFLILIFLKAIMAVDMVWDSLSYHMPFSALRVGLMTDWQFQRPPPEQDTLKGYYLGAPILADLLRGWMWKYSGRPEAVNLLGIISVLALIAYLKWAFRTIEIAWVLIGILAIPAVQTAVAGNYVDLPSNAAFTIYLFSIVDLWSNPDKFRRPAPWVVMFLAAFAAANIKLQTSVFVCLAMPFILPPVWHLMRKRHASWPRMTVVAILGLCAAMLVACNLIKNLVLYDNPFFPIDITIGGLHFPGTLHSEDWGVKGSPYARTPQLLRWLLSVLEYRSLDGRSIPYMNGMGDVPPTSYSSYMGGSFSALLVASICFLTLCAIRRRDPLSRNALIAFVVSGAIVSALPNSENLRYETFWMMFAIIGCLLLLNRPSLGPYLQSYKIVLIASLVFVTSVTGGVYFTPVWAPTQEYVDRSGYEKLLEAVVKPGDVICLKQGPGEWDNRFAILFAPIFHQKLARERPYAIKEGFCDGYKTIPRGAF